MPFLRDMPADFKYVLGLHERAAAGIGLGYSLGTGKAVFVNLTPLPVPAMGFRQLSMPGMAMCLWLSPPGSRIGDTFWRIHFW